jgi:hypothetical protein
MMPEAQARRHLRGRVGTLSVLAPVGSFAGRGELRVLRVSFGKRQADTEERIDLMCGYEAYEAMR